MIQKTNEAYCVILKVYVYFVLTLYKLRIGSSCRLLLHITLSLCPQHSFLDLSEITLTLHTMHVAKQKLKPSIFESPICRQAYTHFVSRTARAETNTMLWPVPGVSESSLEQAHNREAYKRNISA